MRTKLALIVAAAISAIAAPPVVVQAMTVASPGVGTAPSPRALALARRYIIATHRERHLVSFYAEAYKNLGNPCKTGDCQRDREVPFEESVKISAPEFLDRIAKIWATALTEDELTQAVEFAESPVGQSIVRKGDAFATLEAPVAADFARRVVIEAGRRFCGKHPKSCFSTGF